MSKQIQVTEVIEYPTSDVTKVWEIHLTDEGYKTYIRGENEPKFGYEGDEPREMLIAMAEDDIENYYEIYQ